MKTIVAVLILIIFWTIISFAQSRVQTGIQDNPIRTYNVYAEVKLDTSTSVLKEDLDILKTNVSQYLVTLENQTTSGDTLTGDFPVAVEDVAYVKVGVVALSSKGKKPSFMKVSKWLKVSGREPKPLSIFIEEE